MESSATGGTQGCRARKKAQAGRTVRWGPSPQKPREARPSAPPVAMHLLVALVVVPVARGIGAGGTAEGLLACVPQHVAFEVHTLVAAVVAKAAPRKGLSPEWIRP